MPRSHRPTILVVEDDAAVRKLVRAILRGNGYQVVEAGNGQQALALFRAGAPSIALAIIDIKMPGICGLDLAAELNTAQAPLPILYISGLARSVAVESLTHSAPERILQKPFSPEQLVERVRSLLA
jgi:two-component system, cell cycle sensor histidine kinase and response regulator CckA